MTTPFQPLDLLTLPSIQRAMQKTDEYLNPIQNILADHRDEELAPYYERMAQALVQEQGVNQTVVGRKNQPILGVRDWINAPGTSMLMTLLTDVLHVVPDPTKSLVAGVADVFGTQRTTEQIGAGGTPVDITDPKVDIGDRQLNEYERLVRGFRYFGASLRHSLTSPTGTPGTAGIQRAVLEGQLAAPRDKQEQLVTAIAPMLAGLGVFAPLGFAAAGESIATRLGAAAPGTAGPSTVLGSAIGRELFPTLASGTTFDALLGGLFGAGEAQGKIGPSPVTAGETLGSIADAARMGMAFRPAATAGKELLGGAVDLFRSLRGARTPIQQAQALSAIERLRDEGFVSPNAQTVLGDRVAHKTKSGRTVYRWKEGSPNYDAANPSRFAPAPTPEEEATIAHQIVDKYRQTIEQTTPEASPDVAPPPEDMLARQNDAKVIGALWYNNQSAALEHTAPEVLDGQLQMLKQIVGNAALPENTRLTAYGRQLAIESLLRRSSGTIGGTIPIEAEALAIETVRRNRPVIGEQGLQMMAGRYEDAGDPMMAERIRHWAKSEVPEREHTAVMAELNKLSRVARKGFSEGSQAITKDGQIVEIMSEPDYGRALVRDISQERADPFYVGTEELHPMPRPRTVLRTTDGRLVRVKTVSPEKGQFTGIDAATKEPVNLTFADIAEVTDRTGRKRLTEEELGLHLQKKLVDDTQPVPSTPAVIKGEAVTVEEIGSNAAKVRTRSGKVKMVPREDLERSTEVRPQSEQIQELLDQATAGPAAKGKRGAAPTAAPKVTHVVRDRDIAAFSPMTTPEPGNKILFFNVAKDQVPAFEQAYHAGPLTPETFPASRRGKAGPQPMVHVLPQEASQNTALYALEAPGSLVPMKAYSDLAKSAIGALGGGERMATYLSPVDLPADALAAARIYRVPEELHAAAQQPLEGLQGMDQAAQTAYLRHLIAFNETVHPQVAAAAAPLRTAAAAEIEASATNRPEPALEARKERVKASAEVVKAIVQEQVDAYAPFEENAVPEWLGVAREPAPPGTGPQADQPTAAAQDFIQKGLTDDTKAYYLDELKALVDAPREVQPFERIQLLNANDPELRLVVYKVRVPEITKAGKPTTTTLWRAEPTLANGRALKEGIKEFGSPEQLIQHITDGGYVAGLHKSVRADYIHPTDPDIRGTIIPIGKEQYEAVIEVPNERALKVLTEGPPATAVKKVKAPKNLAVLIGRAQHEVGSGATLTQQLNRKVVGSFDEAEQFLSQHGLEENPDARIEESLVDLFPRLPKIEDLAQGIAAEGEQGVFLTQRGRLQDIEDALGNLMARYIQVDRHIPAPVREYAERFADLYTNVLDRPPFSRELRFALDLPSINDLGPAGQKGINYNELAGGLPEGVKYKKGWGAPAPDIKKPGDQPGVYDAPTIDEETAVPLDQAQQRAIDERAGELGIPPDIFAPEGGLDVKPVMHIHSDDNMSRVVPKDYYKLYGKLLGYKSKPSVPEVEAAAKIGEMMIEQERMAPTVLRALNQEIVQPGNVAGSEGRTLGRYKPTGQVVEVLDASPADPTMRVKFPGEAPIDIATEDFEPSRFYNKDLSDHTFAQHIADGTYQDYVKREPEPGYGQEERAMGLLGAHPDVINQAFQTRAAEIAHDIHIAENGVPTGNFDELRALYRRGLWLDNWDVKSAGRSTVTIPAEARAEPGTGGQTFVGKAREFVPRRLVSEGILGALRSTDPALIKPFKLSIYHSIRQELGDSPLAHLQAKAFMGALSDKHVKLLRTWGSELGLSKDLPTARIVAELAYRKAFDPHAARVAVELQNDAGFLRWSAGLNTLDVSGAGPGGEPLPVQLRFSRPSDPSMGIGLSRPWKLLSRMPQSKFLLDGIGDAQTAQARRLHETTLFITDLFQNGYKHEDWLAARQLIQRHPTWNAAVEAGANPKHEYLFNALKSRMALNKEDLIRQALRSGVNAIQFDPKNPQHVSWLKDLGIEPADIDQTNFAFLPREVDLAKNWQGVEPHPYWNHDRIEEFLALQRRYKSSADLPSDTPDEARRVFDLWKRYGIENYWPLIHEGNRAVVVVSPHGEERLVAWAQSHYDALNHVEELTRQGKINPTDNVKIQMRSTVDDDIVVKLFKDVKEWKNIQRMFVEAGNVDNAQALLLRSDAPIPPARARRGRQVHLKERTLDLQPVVPDPIKELQLYEARLARSDFRYNVSQSFRLFQDRALDRAMANRYGLEPLWKRNGKANYTNLVSYAEDYVRSALGQQNKFEIWQDRFRALTSMFSNGPLFTVQKLIREFKGGEYPLTLEEIWNQGTYFRKYGARESSSTAVALQSILKLGFSPMSALANSTQFLINTYPKLIEKGFNEVQATALLFQSWKDAIKIWGRGVPGIGRALGPLDPSLARELALMDRAGIALVPGKHMAGESALGTIAGQVPLNIGQGKAALARDWAKYTGMFGFNGAESVNRYATGLAAIRRALQKGMSEEAAIAGARRLVRETQFNYDELSLPAVMRGMGPVGRVLLQFKPFMVNMLAYEKDLMTNALRFNGTTSANVAWRQLGAHVAGLAIFGGATGLLYHPAFTLLGKTIKLFTGGRISHVAGIPLTAEDLQADRRAQRLAMKTPEEAFTETLHYDWDDLLLYGVPGLAHVNLGQRIGVSGQDLTIGANASAILGPHFGAEAEFLTALGKYIRSPDSGRGTLGAAAGAILPSFIPGKVGQWIRNQPYTRSLSAGFGAAVASTGSYNSFKRFLFGSSAVGDESPEGRALMTRAYPVAVRNAMNTWELYNDLVLRDIDGKPMHLPAANRTEELFYMLGSAPTIRRTEYASAISMMVGDGAALQTTRQSYVDRIARARSLGTEAGYIEANKLILRASEQGVSVPESSIQREVETLTNERIETIRQQQPRATRWKRP